MPQIKYDDKQKNKRKKKGVKIEFTCERVVFRSTVGDSCYVVPMMFWINVMRKSIINQRFRIIQTELLENNMDKYIVELLCFWSPNFPPCLYAAKLDNLSIDQFRYPDKYLYNAEHFNNRHNADNNKTIENQSNSNLKTIRKAITFKCQDNEQNPEFIVNREIVTEFNEFFTPCNRRLTELLTNEMPKLMLLDSFDINMWDS